jgi:hypothetical protein
VRGSIKNIIAIIGEIDFKFAKKIEKMEVWREQTDSKLGEATKSKDFLYMDVVTHIVSLIEWEKESKDTLLVLSSNINELPIDLFTSQDLFSN